ncbi:hypothetical protein QT972_02130 [Microcoleus sp. herbarium7]
MPPQTTGDTPCEVPLGHQRAVLNLVRLLKIGYQSVVIGGI